MTKEPAAAPAAEAAAAPAAAAPAAEAAKGKKKTGLIVGIIIAVLALAGGIVALVLILNNNSKKDPVSAVTDATKNTYRALDGVNLGIKKETTNVDNIDGMDLTVDGTVSVKGSVSNVTIDGDLDFTAKIAKNKDVEVSLDVDALVNSQALKGSFDAVVTNDAVYAKLGNLKNMMSFASEMQGEDASFLESDYSTQMLAMLDNQWIKVTADEADQGKTPVKVNFSLSGKQDTLSQLQEYVDIEAYNGNEVQSKIGDLYKLTPKEGKASGDPVYVEIKDDKLVRLYTKSNNASFGEAAFDGEISFDITLNYDKVEINVPENALDIFGGQVNPGLQDPQLPEDIYDLDDDEIEELKSLCSVLGESDLNACFEKLLDNYGDYDYGDDFDFDYDSLFEDYDFEGYDYDELLKMLED